LQRILNRILESYQAAPGARAPGNPLPGTVFLADVEFLPRDVQERLVGICSPPGALRLMASTTMTLAELGPSELVRPDFHALVSPLAIELPALSQRIDDLPLLAQHFLEDRNRQEQKQVGGFDEQVWPLLTRYAWPGNLDELAAVVGDAHAHATATLIRAEDLPFRFRTSLSAQEVPPPPAPPPMHLDPLLTRVEARLITLALERSRNNKSRAAELLGINRARLLRRIEQLQIGASAAPGDEVEGAESESDADDERTTP
jgi:DNA-binding NtrC family response regulator